MSRLSLGLVMAAPALLLSSVKPNTGNESVQLTIVTLHAASLTTARTAGDSTDAPFFVMSVVGPHMKSGSILPDAGKSIRVNEQLGARPLTQLSLAAGDSVKVLVSVLENSSVKSTDAPVVESLVKQGANLVGTVSMLVTNEGGAIFWRKLECVASCKVLNGPAATAVSGAQPAAGVVELSGNGGTYHLALRAAR
jgi:hypothetical protein